MFEFLICFLPSTISTAIYRNNKEEKDVKELIINYGIFLTINNLLTLLVVIFKHFNEAFGFDRINLTFCFKYLLVSTIFSVITPYIVKIFVDTIEIKVEVKKNDKNKK